MYLVQASDQVSVSYDMIIGNVETNKLMPFGILDEKFYEINSV